MKTKVKDGEYFVKVYIKSGKDLPKKGRCYVHQIMYDETLLTLFDFALLHRKLWENTIDWYLLPVDALPKTDFKPVKSAEEILLKHLSNEKLYSKSDIEHNKDILTAMEEYASQTDLRLPTDEEIKSYIQSRCRFYGGNISQEEIAIECAKWMRDSKGTDLREKLIKYTEYLFGKEEQDKIKIVDEYLKTKQ